MSKDKELRWTGERMVDNATLAKGIVEHLHRYAIALDIVEDKIVLDIACGEGYGSNLLAEKAQKVYGIDISKSTIQHASEKYKKPNLMFLEGSVVDIPLKNNSIDVAVSFETLEHLVEQEKMLEELKRVLKPEGLLIISTPEKANYAEIDPNNLFHLKELTFEEFESLLKSKFLNVKIAFQRFLFSSQIIEDYENSKGWTEYFGSFDKIAKRNSIGGHYFNIAFCSNMPGSIPIGPSIFNGNDQFKKLEQAMFGMFEVSNSWNLAVQQVRNSKTYRIGALLLSPYRLIKGLFRKQ